MNVWPWGKGTAKVETMRVRRSSCRKAVVWGRSRGVAMMRGRRRRSTRGRRMEIRSGDLIVAVEVERFVGEKADGAEQRMQSSAARSPQIYHTRERRRSTAQPSHPSHTVQHRTGVTRHQLAQHSTYSQASGRKRRRETWSSLVDTVPWLRCPCVLAWVPRDRAL
jgi:hypothetical protein